MKEANYIIMRVLACTITCLRSVYKVMVGKSLQVFIKTSRINILLL